MKMMIRKSDNKLVSHCIFLEDITVIWLTEHWTLGNDNTKGAEQDMKNAKMYSTIYKDLDCREVLKRFNPENHHFL